MKPLHTYYFRLPYSGEECLLEERPSDFGYVTHGIALTDASGELITYKPHGAIFKVDGLQEYYQKLNGPEATCKR